MSLLRIFHYSPWYTYTKWQCLTQRVENLSLFALIYLEVLNVLRHISWESFIIRLDILMTGDVSKSIMLRIFHYSPWYTYARAARGLRAVENLSLFALIYLARNAAGEVLGWESFIIRLDILREPGFSAIGLLRIFHYSPWYTYEVTTHPPCTVENLSLFALIYLMATTSRARISWESFIIRLDILNAPRH